MAAYQAPPSLGFSRQEHWSGLPFPSPRSKHLLISWLQSPSAVILEPLKIKSVTVSTVSPSICHEMMGPDAMILRFLNVSSQPFHSPLSLSSRGSLFPPHFLPLGWCHLPILLLLLLSHFSRVRLCATPSLGFSRQEVFDISPGSLDSSL